MRNRLTVLLLALALAAAACGPSATDNGEGSTTSSSSATTSTSSTTTTTPDGTGTTAPSTTTTTGASGQATVAAYFLLDDTGANFRPGPFLVPVARNVPETSDPVLAALGELLNGPTEGEAGSVPAISTAIPDNTVLLGVTVTDGIATVDLSSEFETGGGTFSMSSRLAQVVFTTTQVPEIESVVFELDGEPVTVFSSEGLLIEAPLTRDDYQDLVPGILVDAPAYGGEPGNPARITGVAAAFEAVFQVAMTDRDGLILNETFVMTDNGMGWGTFDALITYEVDEPQWGSLIVWENSANDGSQINVREYPVWLTPGS